MKRIIACIVVLVSVLVATPAGGQSPWYPREGEAGEWEGEAVVMFTARSPGRLKYYTGDGDCDGYPSAEDPANGTPVSPDECGRPYARESEDYVAVRGEWTFNEAGSITIRIPIIDDDLDEADGEAFRIESEYQPDSCAPTVNCGGGLYTAYIRIRDDDPRNHRAASNDGASNDGAVPPPAVVTTITTAGQRLDGSSVVATEPPPDLEVALPSGELEPGPGFELVLDRDADPRPEHDDRDGDSASWWPLGLGTTALASGVVVWMRRRRRWSPTRS